MKGWNTKKVLAGGAPEGLAVGAVGLEAGAGVKTVVGLGAAGVGAGSLTVAGAGAAGAGGAGEGAGKVSGSKEKVPAGLTPAGVGAGLREVGLGEAAKVVAGAEVVLVKGAAALAWLGWPAWRSSVWKVPVFWLKTNWLWKEAPLPAPWLLLCSKERAGRFRVNPSSSESKSKVPGLAGAAGLGLCCLAGTAGAAAEPSAMLSRESRAEPLVLAGTGLLWGIWPRPPWFPKFANAF